MTAAEARARELDEEVAQSGAYRYDRSHRPFFKARQRLRQASTVQADRAAQVSFSWAQPALLPQSTPAEEREQNAILRVSDITKRVVERYFFHLRPDYCGLDNSLASINLSISMSGHLACMSMRASN